jgi:hypothetical protein
MDARPVRGIPTVCRDMDGIVVHSSRDHPYGVRTIGVREVTYHGFIGF